MKTKYSYLLWVALFAGLSLTSCLKDTFAIDFDEAASITIIELPYRTHTMVASNQVPTANYTFSNLLVNCTAVFLSDIKADIQVTLAVETSMVGTYNNENGLDGTTAARQPYVLMPSDAYTVPTTVTIKAGEREASYDVPVNTSSLEPGQKYIIPVKITNVPAPYTISGNFGHLYLRVDMRAL